MNFFFLCISTIITVEVNHRESSAIYHYSLADIAMGVMVI